MATLKGNPFSAPEPMKSSDDAGQMVLSSCLELHKGFPFHLKFKSKGLRFTVAGLGGSTYPGPSPAALGSPHITYCTAVTELSSCPPDMSSVFLTEYSYMLFPIPDISMLRHLYVPFHFEVSIQSFIIEISPNIHSPT